MPCESCNKPIRSFSLCKFCPDCGEEWKVAETPNVNAEKTEKPEKTERDELNVFMKDIIRKMMFFNTISGISICKTICSNIIKSYDLQHIPEKFKKFTPIVFSTILNENNWWCYHDIVEEKLRCYITPEIILKKSNFTGTADPADWLYFSNKGNVAEIIADLSIADFNKKLDTLKEKGYKDDEIKEYIKQMKLEKYIIGEK